MPTNFLWSGYLASAAEAIDGANMNSLANGSLTCAGEASDTITEIDNTTNKYTYADFELALASLNITSSVARVDLFIIPTHDGTNYPDYTVGASLKLAEQNYYAGTFAFHIANAAQKQVIRGVLLPPGKFRVGVINRTGVAFGASGNTLKYRAYTDQY